MSCEHHEYGDLEGNECALDGKKCHWEDNEDECPCFKPSEWAVMNGFFSDDPDGFERWEKERARISCKTCEHHGSIEFWCASCWNYDLHKKKDEIEDLQVEIGSKEEAEDFAKVL